MKSIDIIYRCFSSVTNDFSVGWLRVSISHHNHANALHRSAARLSTHLIILIP